MALQEGPNGTVTFSVVPGENDTAEVFVGTIGRTSGLFNFAWNWGGHFVGFGAGLGGL